MIVLFTDFGPGGPYTGQLQAVFCQQAPGIPVVDLVSDVPAYNPAASACLLAALASGFPKGCVFLCVVDPGVGSPQRAPIVLYTGGRWYVGPDNGLFGQLDSGQADAACWEILWRPPELSNTFHGRDLFAPVAAALARGERPGGGDYRKRELPLFGKDSLPPQLIYLDHFGNAWSNLRAECLAPDARLQVAGQVFFHAGNYAAVVEGGCLWYVNSSGLVELAINQGNAARSHNLRVGLTLEIIAGT